MNGHDGAGHGVEAGGEHDHVHVECALIGLDAGRGDRPDRLLPQIDQGDVGPVVGRVVVGLEARAFGPKRMVAGCECGRRFGILHDGADPLADQVGRQRVALDLDSLVRPQLCQHDDEIAGRQCRLETLATLGLAELPAELRCPRQWHTGQRPAGLLTVVGAVFFDQSDAVGRRRTVVRREGEVRGALENRQMGRLLGDQRNRLDARGSRADDRDALARELDVLARPAAGKVDLTLEIANPVDLRRLGRAEAAARHDVACGRTPAHRCWW